MAGAGGRIAFKVVAMVVAIPVGRIVTTSTRKAWTKARPQDPLVNPKDIDTNWQDALIWAGLTGVGAGVTQLLTTKGADTVWRAMTGKPSPRPKNSQPKNLAEAKAAG